MGRKILLAGLIIVSVCGVSALPASASTPKPTIKRLSPTSATVGTEVTIKGTYLVGATRVTFNGEVARVISDTATKIQAYVPAGATTGYIKVKTPGGTAKSASRFTVLRPLNDTMSVASDGSGYCSLLTSGGVDCWGQGFVGQLGNGTFSESATPVVVEGVGGTGTLEGVTNITSGGEESYCALLISGGVDCWGLGEWGELGNGTFYSSPSGSATPVAVESVGGTGTLGGVTNITGGGADSYCALLTSGGVDCWGYGYKGQLGNGTFYTSSPWGSATPVAVEGVGGTGSLTEVTKLVGVDFYGGTYCALLTWGAMDCWGYGDFGELGNGTFSDSATPVAVEGVGGTGTLEGVTNITSDGEHSFCALLTPGGVDCWGEGGYGELGNGMFYASSPYGSSTPVAVEGVGGTGTLGGVTNLTGGGAGSYCALLTSGGVDCWGFGMWGQLGNGTFYTSSPFGSATPVAVEGVGGPGSITGVTNLANDGSGYCALLTSSGVDCWGSGESGDLGNGTFSGSATPVAVEGVGGPGSITGVTNLASDGSGYCALLTSSGVDCWGSELGNGTFSDSATPVVVG